LLEELRKAVTETEVFCKAHGVDLEAVQTAEGFERIKLLDDAVDALVATDETKKRYLNLAAGVRRLYKAVLPDPSGRELGPVCILFNVIARKILALTAPADISGVMGAVEDLLDESIAAEGYVIREPVEGYSDDHLVDLSEIDFEALRRKFERGRKRTEAERVKGAVSRKLHQMVRLNRTRLDYLDRFQRMIDEYNAGSVNVEEFFRRLIEFARDLNEEDQRSVGEQLSEEELAVFDLLTRPEMELAEKERAQVKQTARELLETLKRETLVLDWRKRQQSRAQVRVTIETVLDQGLPEAYTAELYQKKAEMVFQHIYDSYYGAGKSVYAAVA
jgi:type I restriction enzyme R subunit